MSKYTFKSKYNINEMVKFCAETFNGLKNREGLIEGIEFRENIIMYSIKEDDKVVYYISEREILEK